MPGHQDPPADGRAAPWLFGAVIIALLALAVGSRMSWGREGVVATAASLGEQVAEVLGGLLGISPHRHRCGPNVGSNLRQIAMGMICYSAESDGAWPRDFQQLQAWYDGELVPKLFRDPRWPSDPDPFIYVRPSKTAKPDQPVLLTRPTTGAKPTVVICYADGHIGTVAGRVQWNEARRLARLPKTQAEGIAPEDWTSVPQLRRRP